MDRQIAKWIPHDLIEDDIYSYAYGYAQCSNCKKVTWLAVTKSNTMNYCPECGAEMIGVVERRIM